MAARRCSSDDTSPRLLASHRPRYNWFRNLWKLAGLAICGPSRDLRRLLRQPSAFVSMNECNATY
eukprot:8506852-Lingulodinium_polyedra.AAC.1